MVATLTRHLKENPPKGFSSVPHYFASGDYLTYFLKDVPYIAERWDDVVTVYRCRITRELVGCKVKGVRHILETTGEFSVPIEDGDLKLGFFFILNAAPSRADDSGNRYCELKQIAGVSVKLPKPVPV